MTKEIDKQLDDKEKKLRKKIEKQVENKKYQDKITPIQQKFIENYTSKYGQWSATQCAIAAGYSPSSAHTRAAELLDRDDTVLKTYIFKNAWPKTISGLSLDTTNVDAIAEFTCTWKYQNYSLSGVNF